MFTLAVWVMASLLHRQAGVLKFRGNDDSFIPQVEAAGGVYRMDGKVTDPFTIYQKSGLNVARLRVWVNPTDGWCDKAHTLALAKRAKAAGQQLYIDFHYSDTWADPGKQPKPKAWVPDHGPDLEKDVANFTYDVLKALDQQDTPPIVVSIGNEVRNGMLWPDGQLDGSPAKWTAFARFFNAGANATKAVFPNARVMLHFDQGAGQAQCQAFYMRALAEGMKFDLIGLSYYPWWHGTLEQLKRNLDNLSRRFRQPIWVVETSYPWTFGPMSGGFHMVGEMKQTIPGYQPTPAGQAAYLAELSSIVAASAHGEGLIYWAGDWLKVKGGESTWENMTLFDGDGNALPSLSALGGK